MMENFLCPYIEQAPHTGVQQLPLKESASNNEISVTMGSTPFCLNSGIHPTVPTLLIARVSAKTMNESVKVMLEWMKTALAEA